MKETRNNLGMDLKQIFYVLRERIVMILMVAFVCGALSYIFTETSITPLYSSKSSVYIVNWDNSDSKATSSDLAAATSLTQDFERMLESDVVMDEVIANLGLNMSAYSLRKGVNITNPLNTRMLEITATSEDPVLAKKIADELARVGREQLVRLMRLEEVNIVDFGKVPTAPSSPNVKRNVAVCSGVGGILICIWFLVQFFMDDTIKSAADVERYLNTNVLASLPYCEEEDVDKNKEAKKWFKQGKKHKHKSKSKSKKPVKSARRN